MHANRRVFSVALLVLGACGPDVTGGDGGIVSADDATGNAASGFYSFETRTTACSGACRVAVSDITVGVCDVGARVDATATVTQTDGHLQIDSDDSDYISRLEGGLDADGSFDVSGVRTQEGISSTIHATGTIAGAETPTATIAGVVSGRVTGSLDGYALDCTITAELSGRRERSDVAPTPD